jgi:hypothetical protein
MNPVVVLRTLFDSAWNTSKGMDINYSLILIRAHARDKKPSRDRQEALSERRTSGTRWYRSLPVAATPS